MSKKRYYDTTRDEAFYHIIFRATSDHCDGSHYQMTDEMKTYLVNLLRRYDAFYQVDVLAYCMMSTHGHLVLRCRKDAEKSLQLTEVAERYQQFHSQEKRIDARSVKCRKIKKRLNSISDFMGRFLRESSLIWNLQSGGKWSGHFWRERFKSICLEDGKALSTCLKYVELNPVRAKMVKDPADYKWSSWGERQKGRGGRMKGIDNGQSSTYGGKHPYRERIIASLRYVYDISIEQMNDAKIWAIYTRDLTVLSLCSTATKAEMIEKLSEAVYRQLLESNPMLTGREKVNLDELSTARIT